MELFSYYIYFYQKIQVAYMDENKYRGGLEKKEVIGGLKINYCLLASSPILIMTISLFYYISISRGQQYPYPWLSITSTTFHHPQSLIFRYSMGFFAGYFFFFYHTLFDWMKRQVQIYSYQGCTYKKMYWPTFLSVNGFFLIIATVDSQGVNSTIYEAILHFGGAAFFFLFLGLFVFFWTLICVNFWRINREFMKTWSVALKVIFSGYLFLYLFVYLPCFRLWQYLYVDQAHRELLISFGNMAQWNLIYVSLIWILLSFSQIKDYKVILVGQKKLEQPIENNVLSEVDVPQEETKKANRRLIDQKEIELQ